MTIIDIGDLPDALYRRLQLRAAQQHRSIEQEVTHILEEALHEPEPLSILELQGLGKEVWKGIDAAEFVESVRRSWD